MRYVWMMFFCVLLFDVGSSSAAPFLYVANSRDDTVSVIDTETNTVIATVNVDPFPTVIAADPFGRFLYVNSGGKGTTTVIDSSTNDVVGTVSTVVDGERIELINGPTDIAFHPNGTLLYATNGKDVLVIETLTNTLVETIDVDGDAFSVEVHPAGTFLYVANTPFDEVIVVDTATHRVVERVTVDPFVWDMVIDPAGQFLYVGSIAKSSISVIDTVTNTVVAKIVLGPDGQGFNTQDIQVHPEGTFVYVADSGPEAVIGVVDTTINELVGSIPGEFSDMALHPAGTVLYAANRNENSVAVIDTVTNTVVDTISVGNRPEAVAIAQPVSRRISGCVDRGGIPLVQHNVTLKQTDETRQKTRTDAKGCYAFERFTLGKKFQVIIKGSAMP